LAQALLRAMATKWPASLVAMIAPVAQAACARLRST
jgi:hypothetical protein